MNKNTVSKETSILVGFGLLLLAIPGIVNFGWIMDFAFILIGIGTVYWAINDELRDDLKKREEERVKETFSN